MNSINGILGERTNISYSDLKSISNGTYNKGEIVLKKGFFGGYCFGKVNNHMTKVGKNTVVTSDADNQKTNAAVFKAILTRFGKGNEDAAAELLSTDIDKVGDELLQRFNNPYIKEAFKFLLADCNDSRAVSRDEVHVLILRLKEAEQKPGSRQVRMVRKNMNDLEILRTFKINGKFTETNDTPVYNGLKGIIHADYGTTKRDVLFQPTVNQLAQTTRARMERRLNSLLSSDDKILRAFAPEIFNNLVDRFAKAADKYRGRELADFEADDCALVKELINELTADIGPVLVRAADTLTSGLTEYRDTREYKAISNNNVKVTLPDGTTCRKVDVEFWQHNGLPKSLADERNQTPAAKKQVMLGEIRTMLSNLVTTTCLGRERTAEEVDRDTDALFRLQAEINGCLANVGSGFQSEQA